MNFLDVDRLKEVAFLALLLVSSLSVHNDFALVIHCHVFEAFAFLNHPFLFFSEEKVFFRCSVCLLVERFEHFLVVLPGFFFLQNLEFDVNIDRDAFERKQLLHIRVDCAQVRLLLLHFIAQRFIEHVSDSLGNFQVVMRQHVSQFDNLLPIVADKLFEVSFVLVCHHLDNWSEYKTEYGGDHGHVGKFGGVAAEESTAFVIEVLASVGDVRKLIRVCLHSEVVD